jgi:lipopolysaccharide transport system ATP-binding protein
MSKIAIKVENLSKAYQIGQFGTGTIISDMQRWWSLVRGKEDPFLKIGETNVRSEKGRSNIVWSLKDISFDIQQGEAIGIIGKNGAGKSTLLKILSQVTSPTKGTINMRGRVASLLEVGTGFHPELTGRENIYLNGAILGMTKAEIKNKFDEILDFSGVERYVDTPVKRYSSGMYVRLAFAVAAHLESEILIVDEVLAVGDTEFQKKCLNKMNDITTSYGRTILFVSHNLPSIRTLCSKSIVLANGQLDYQGSSNDAIEYYQKNEVLFDRKLMLEIIDSDNLVKLNSLEISNSKKEEKLLYRENDIIVDIEYEILVPELELYSSIHINHGGQCVFVAGNQSRIHIMGKYKTTCIIPNNLFNNLQYSLSVFLVRNKKIMSIRSNDIIYFNINEKSEFNTNVEGIIRPEINYMDSILI